MADEPVVLGKTILDTIARGITLDAMTAVRSEQLMEPWDT